MVLEKIHKENDIKNLSPEELTMLADEIRQFLIEKCDRRSPGIESGGCGTDDGTSSCL